jgi:hypothetical protein
MGGCDDLNHGSYPDGLPDGNPPPAVEKASLSDPGLISDGHRLPVVPLQDGPVADIDMISDGYGSRMKDQDLRLDDDMFPNRFELTTRKPPGPMTSLNLERSELHLDPISSG